MPSYTYNDEDNLEFKLLPEGDYTFEVLSIEFGIQANGKYTGIETMNVRFAFYDAAGNLVAKWKENFMFHKDFWWKIDTFLKSANFMIDGAPPQKGVDIGGHLTEENLLGLRGWCEVHVDEYPAKSGEKKRTNRVKKWSTKKEKLPRRDLSDVPFA